MPIDLVSTEDFSKLAKGAKDAPKAEEPKPLVEKLAEQPKPAEEQKPKVTEKKAVEATKEATPPPQPEQKPDPIAKKAAGQLVDAPAFRFDLDDAIGGATQEAIFVGVT